VRSVSIDVDHSRRRQWPRMREHVNVRARNCVPGEETVTCVVPGHDRTGEELVTDQLCSMTARCVHRPRRLPL